MHRLFAPEPTPLAASGMLAGLDRHSLPHPLPELGVALRVAFVGRRAHDELVVPPASGQLLPFFVGLRDGDDVATARTALVGFAPHVVVVFDPAQTPSGLLDGIPGVKLAWVTAALPRSDIRGRLPRDLDARVAAQRDGDYTAFDRALCVDPLAAEGDGPFWRARPLPVADTLYAPVGTARADARTLFVGRSTAHREEWLMVPKHEFDLLHYAHGLDGQRRQEIFASVDVALNVHPERFPQFGAALPRHLAAGHLVVSQSLAPTHGLEPGIDYVEVANKDELGTVLHQLRRRPDTYQRVRLRGRAKAELFRASVVWPRIIGDLLRELAADAQSSSAIRGALRSKTM